MAPVITAEELLVRVSKRDEDALGDLYDRFAPRLLGMLARILRDRSLAEEILQDVFLRLWSEARTLSEARGSVAAWLVVNARHHALERLRAEKQARLRVETNRHGKLSPQKPFASKSHALKSPVPAALPASWIPLPEEVSRVDERLDLLQKVLNQLPKPQREALELSVFDGYSEEEIARELEEPLGKVRTALCAAVTFLRHRRRAVVGTWAASI
jgi:RNA polymerase sigma-70 factor (ECF subfamily)